MERQVLLPWYRTENDKFLPGKLSKESDPTETAIPMYAP
jgi:hypothetical protein